MKIKNSIKGKILKIIVLSAIFLAMTIAAFSVGVYNNYKRMQISQAKAEISELNAHISLSMEQLQKTAVAAALFGEFYFRQKNRNPDELERVLKEILSEDNLAVGVGVWFEESAINPLKEKSAFYYYRNENGEVVFDSATVAVEYNFMDSCWYKSIRKQILESSDKIVVWTPPYIDDSGSFELMISAGFGIFDKNGNFIGLSTVDWLLSEIIEKITKIKPTLNTITFLAYGDFDNIIAISNSETLPLDLIKTLGENKSFVYKNHRHIFFKISGEKMLVAAIVPERELFAEINTYSLKMILFFVAAVLIIILLIYNFLDKFVSKPVSYLSEKTEKIADGDLDIQISIDSKDEFGQLADSFNSMTSGIRKYISEIKQINEEKGRISAELDVANRIQNSMMPNLFPAFPERSDFDIYAVIHPAKEVGGDFYDFFFIDNAHFAVIIADVSGKGIPAALFMVIAKTLLKNNICSEKNLSAAFTKTNAQLCENNDMGLFVTAFAAIVNIENGKTSFVNAGHNPVYIKRNNSQYERLKSKCGFVLAGMENMVFKEEEITINFGDSLFLYTDGITEAMNENDELFGDERLKNVLTKYSGEKISMPELINGVHGEVKNFAGKAEQSDDITMLAFLYNRRLALIKKSVIFEVSINKLGDVSEFIEKELSQVQCLEKIIKRMLIAVEEIFVNIANYAYSESGNKDNSVEIKLLLNLDAKELQIIFIDGGEPYNPLLKPDPDITLSSSERKIGGLGIYMSKKLTNMQYTFSDGKNILTLTKKWD